MREFYIFHLFLNRRSDEKFLLPVLNIQPLKKAYHIKKCKNITIYELIYNGLDYERWYVSEQ